MEKIKQTSLTNCKKESQKDTISVELSRAACKYSLFILVLGFDTISIKPDLSPLSRRELRPRGSRPQEVDLGSADLGSNSASLPTTASP